MNGVDGAALVIVALGLSGAVWSAGLLLFGATGPWSDLLAVAIALLFARNAAARPVKREPIWLAVACGAAALIVTALFIEHSIRYPEGGWDAVAIWNLRARALYGAPHDLARVFTPELPAQHPDYPLLLPGLIAHGWFLSGTRTQLVPIAISFLFAVACAVALGRRGGLAAAILLLGTPEFLTLAWNQYADLKLAALLLVAVVMASDGRLLAAGLAAGLGAYTKNEGLVWLVTLALAVLIASGWRSAVRMLAGAALPLALLAYFKLRWAPPNDLIAQTSASALARRAPRRLLLVLRGFAWQIMDFGKWGIALPLVLAAWIARWRRRERNVAALFCALSLLALFGIYLATPHDPIEHMATSLDRLIFQLWPSIIYATVVSLVPAEARASVEPQPSESGRA